METMQNYLQIWINLRRNKMQYVNRYTSSIGNITMASDGEALTGLWFDGQKYFGLYLDNENEEKDLPIFDMAKL